MQHAKKVGRSPAISSRKNHPDATSDEQHVETLIAQNPKIALRRLAGGQPAGAPLNLLALQRTIGNRLTQQLLKAAANPQAEASAAPQAPVQRLLSEADLIAAGGARTTGLLGGAKSSLYNTVVDSVARFDRAKASPNIGGDMLIMAIGLVSTAAKAWMEAHGSEKKKAERAAAVWAVWVVAAKLEKAMVKWKNDWLAHGDMAAWYADQPAWALFKQLAARNFTDENTSFYEQVQVYKQTGARKQEIYDTFVVVGSPQQINVSSDVVQAIQAGLAGDDRALFDVAIDDLVQVWGDLYGKSRSDTVVGAFMRSELPL
jgi:hypothetical protein